MSYRPLDWSPVDLSADPIPGDPDTVRRGGRDYQETARQIGRAAASLNAIEAGGQVSLAVDAVMERKTETMDDISRAQDRYRITGEALEEYADTLAAAQETADTALARATTARRDKESAQTSKRVYLNLAADEDDEDAARRYRQLVDDFEDSIDAADATIRQAQADIDQAKTTRDTAAEKAASRIQQITSSDGLNDTWWDDWGAKLTELLDKISAIAGILALVVAFIPIIGQALAAVLLVVTAVTAIASAVLKTVAAAQGHTSWLNAGLSILMAALACTGLGALRGGLAAAKAAGGLKAFTGMGAKSILTGTGRNALNAIKGLGSKGLRLVKGLANKTEPVAAPGSLEFVNPLNSKFAENAARRPASNVDPGGLFDVVTHGSPKTVEIVLADGRVVQADHRMFAQYLRSASGWKPGQPIRLLSCSTGRGASSFAQNLANKLGVDVIGSTGLVYADETGRIFNCRPDVWKVFSPWKP